MAKSKSTTLYTPDGRPYKAGSPAEVTRLKAQGYTDTDPNKKPAPKPSGGSDTGS